MKYLSFFGSSTGIIGALLIALNINMFLTGYLFFLVSSLSWIVYSYKTSQKNLLVMNIVFGVINAIGVYNFI